MKQIILTILGLTALALASCSKEASNEPIPATQGFYAEITATTTSGNDTRVSLENGLQAVWNDDDALAVFDDGTPSRFTVKSNYGSTAVFSGTLTSAAETYYAAYPYEAASSLENGQILLEFPATQCIAEGASTARGALVSVARFNALDDAHFIQATGLVCFSITEEVTAVRISGANGEALAGTARVNALDGSVSEVTAAEKTVTLCAESGTLPAGTYYFAILPQTLSGGFTFEVTDAAGGLQTLTGTGAISVNQGASIRLGDITALLESSQAADGKSSISCGGESVSFDRTVSIRFSDQSSAKVSGASGLNVSIDGNHVTINNTGTDKVLYSLSGRTSNGSLKLYGTVRQALVLNDVSITNPSGAAINNQDKKKTTYVVLNGANYLSDSQEASYESGEEDMKAVLFSENNLSFCGSGSLTVTALNAVEKGGISADDELTVFDGPTLTVNCGSSAGNGLKGKDAVTLAGGTLNVSVKGDGKSAISSDDFVIVSGGTTTLTVSGGVCYDEEDAEYKGSAGVKCDDYFGMTGGSLTITNTGDGGKGINAGSYDFDETGHTLADSYISGGTIDISCSGYESNDVSAKGLKIGWVTKNGTGEHATVTGYAGNLLISGGTVNVSSKGGEGIEVKGTLTITDGIVYGYSGNDDGINCQNDLTISGGFVCAWTTGSQTGADGFDANGNLYVKGGVAYGVCTHGSPDVAFDANTEGGKKLYLQGGTVIAVGGLESGASITGSAYKASSWSNSTWYGLWDSSSQAVVAFRTPSNGNSLVVYSGGNAVTLKSGVSYSGTSIFGGNAYIPGSISNGSSVSLSTYTGGGGPGGGGHGPH